MGDALKSEVEPPGGNAQNAPPAAAVDGGHPPSPGFEGPEKNLELDFVPDLGPPRGLREITRGQWDAILTEARCTILNTMSNGSCDSYVLSESSLFVYSHKMILKTCGTTTLLMALEPLIAAARALGMSLEWLAYTRKDFTFPLVQKFPHRDPLEETTFLKRLFPSGHAYVMGPLTADHWYVFVADFVDRPTEMCVDRTLDMMMFNIDPEVSRLFFKDAARFPADADVTRAAGIHTLLPGSSIQEFAFEPCGYSMNGLLYDAYWTIHITPESHCSYASFETNIRMTHFGPLVKAVLAIFKPARFTMTLFADTHGAAGLRESPFQQVIAVPVVESTAHALSGPCVVLSHDADGAPVIALPGGGSAGASPSATPRDAPAADAAGDGGAAPPPAAAAPEGPQRQRRSPSNSGGGGGGAGGGAGGGGAAMTYVMSAKSHTEFLGEYFSVLGNFVRVHTSERGAGPSEVLASSEVPIAASSSLANPRVKYVVARSARNVLVKGRTTSM